MVKNILIINIGIHIVGYLLNMDFSKIFGVHYVFSEDFYVFQYLTYMWLHANKWHLFSNMFGLFIFGPLLESVWGAKRFLIYYLITGVGAGLLYAGVDTFEKNSIKNKAEIYASNPNPDDFNIFIVNTKAFNFTIGFEGERMTLSEVSDKYYDEPNNVSLSDATVSWVFQIYKAFTNSNMVGASGALYGILIAFGMLFPERELLLLFPPIPIKAKYLVFFYGAISVYQQINQAAGDNVAHLAHLGGMLIGFLVLKYWQSNRGSFY